MSAFFNSLKNLATGAAHVAGTTKYEEASNHEGGDVKVDINIAPQPSENGFAQWLDAMKMVARLSDGIPHEFRKKLWLILADRHLEQRGIDWKSAEKLCFNEWTSPDDEKLGIQIVKERGQYLHLLNIRKYVQLVLWCSARPRFVEPPTDLRFGRKCMSDAPHEGDQLHSDHWVQGSR